MEEKRGPLSESYLCTATVIYLKKKKKKNKSLLATVWKYHNFVLPMVQVLAG